MPFVRIQSKSGRTPEQKEKLATSIVKAMEEQGFATPDAVHVIFEDMVEGDYYPGKEIIKKD